MTAGHLLAVAAGVDWDGVVDHALASFDASSIRRAN